MQAVRQLQQFIELFTDHQHGTASVAQSQQLGPDLSGSAAIEWYADHVWMQHRDPYFFGWHTLSEEKKKGWADAVEPRRERNPQCWSSGGKYGEEDGGWPREDYEQDAKIYVRKNRRGPTPELHVRFEDWRTWFSSRMPKLNSTDWRDWQFGSYAVPKKEPKMKKAGQVRSSLHDDFPD